jgi:hypothetical protein
MSSFFKAETASKIELKSETESFVFPELSDLTLDSTHLQHVNLAGRGIQSQCVDIV